MTPPRWQKAVIKQAALPFNYLVGQEIWIENETLTVIEHARAETIQGNLCEYTFAEPTKVVITNLISRNGQRFALALFMLELLPHFAADVPMINELNWRTKREKR